jgi:hypothetical protein
MMNRWSFLCGLTGTLAVPLTVGGQQAAKVRVIGAMDAADSRGWTEFHQGLRDLGWNEERRLVIEFRWNGTKGDRYRELAGELVRMNVDVIALFDALWAFCQEHEYCGELDGGVEGDRVWMTCTCGAVINRDADRD